MLWALWVLPTLVTVLTKKNDIIEYRQRYTHIAKTVFQTLLSIRYRIPLIGQIRLEHGFKEVRRQQSGSPVIYLECGQDKLQYVYF